MDLNVIATRISEKFTEAGYTVDPAKALEKLERFVNEFGIPPLEAERSIIAEYSRQFGMEMAVEQKNAQRNVETTHIKESVRESLSDNTVISHESLSTADITPIDALQPGETVSIEGKVQRVYPSQSPSVAQSGTLADNTGEVKFIVWADSNVKQLETGKKYRLDKVLVDEYNGRVNFKVNTDTTVTEIGNSNNVSDMDTTSIGELKAGEWITVEGVVRTLFQSNSPSIAQSGIISDDSGSVRFTIWQNMSASFPLLEVGKKYKFESAVSDEYNGKISLKVHNGTIITELPYEKEEQPVTPLSELKPGNWVTIEGVVQLLYPKKSPAVAQSGIFADKSGNTRFTVWASAKAPLLEVAKRYRIESAQTDEFNGRINFKVDASSVITPIEGNDSEDEITPLNEIHTGLLTVHVKVVSISDRSTDFIAQSGILADNTGAARFSIRRDCDVSPLVENKWYKLSNVSCDLYRGAFNLQINASSKIEALDEDVSIRLVITKIADLKPGIACVRVKMVQEWEVRNDRMQQTGIIGDETGTCKFVIWKDNNMGPIRPDVVYDIYYASIDEFNERISIILNGAKYLPDDTATIEVKQNTEDVSGVLVHISPGSGLVKRCPVEGCNRILSRMNFCPVHEQQTEGISDLRLKGWLDNGNKTWDTVISRDAIEKLLGFSVKDAEEMAEFDPLGSETVYYHLCEKLIGRYLCCHGRVIENRLFVNACEFIEPDKELYYSLIEKLDDEGETDTDSDMEGDVLNE